MEYAVDVEGTHVVVQRPRSMRPRLLVDGAELPADRWGRRMLTLPDGSQEEVQLGATAVLQRPRLEVGGRHYDLEPPPPVWVVVPLAAFVVLGFFGGALGAVLALVGAGSALRLLRHPPRRFPHVMAAGGVLVLAAGIYVALSTLIGRLL